MYMKQGYASPRVLQVTEIELETGILTGSVIDKLTVESTGQEVGGVFDYSAPESSFNHEWGE